MDQRTREIQREWNETGDIELHAELLRMLLRQGLIEEKRLLCAGFFGHKACAMALPESIKKNKVYYEGRILRTEDLRDFIDDSFIFPRDIYLRMIMPLVDLIVAKLKVDELSDRCEYLRGYIAEYIKYGEGKDKPEGLWPSGLGYCPFNWGTVSQKLWYFIYASAWSIDKKNPLIAEFHAISIEMDDRLFRKTVAKDVIPYLLGDYR